MVSSHMESSRSLVFIISIYDGVTVFYSTDRYNLIKIGNLTAFFREGLDLFFNLKTNKNASTPDHVDVLTLTNIP